jgi:hypothetical protein
LESAQIRGFLDICAKFRLVCDLEDANLLDCELVKAGVIRGSAVASIETANVSPTVAVALTAHTKIVTKYWTPSAIALDFQRLLFVPDHDSSPRIPQRDQ